MRSALAGIPVQYETTATLVIDGDEADYPVRGRMTLEPNAGPGGWGAVLDGDMEACIGGEWVDLDTLEIGASQREGIEESLAEIAFNDDSRCGREWDDE